MTRQYCPRCGAVRNMEVTVSRRKVPDADGSMKEVITRVLHCEACHSFVCAEETEAGKDAEKR